MSRRPLDLRDRLFIVALVVQVAIAVVLGVAIVRVANRSEAGGRVEVVAASPTGAPVAARTGASGRTETRTTVVGGSQAGAGAAGSTGITSGEIKVGGVFTLSGPGDATVALHAAQAYFNKVNDAGGVFGRRIKYVTRDDKFDPSVGYSDVKDLVENEKVFAMAAWVAPNTENQQVVNYLEKKGVPLVGNFGQPPEYKSPVVYSFAVNWPTISRLTVRQLAATLGQKKIALIWVHLSDEIDQIVRQNAGAEAKANGAEIVYTEPVDVAKPVYDDTVVNARQAGATGIVTLLDPFSYSRYWQSFARSDWRPVQVGVGFAMDRSSTSVIPSGYQNVWAIQEMELPSAPTPGIREYLSTMKKYFPRDMEKLNWAAELSWLGAKMFVETLKRAGPKPTRQGIVNALDSMTKFDSGLAPPYTIRPGPHDFVTCMKAGKLTASRTWVQGSDWFCV
jgi:ABC-type branched-subunit amino acid transport system substrate-binding protein